MKCTYFNHIQRFLNILIIVLLLSGCGADDEQKVDDAIDIALSYLTTGDCQRAIDVLEDVGRQSKNYRYVKTLATSYACRGGYLTTSFFESDLPKMTAGAASFLKGFTEFSTSSSMDATDNPDYEDLQEAISILLYAGGIASDKNPTSSRRLNYFSAEQVSNMNMLLLFLSMVNLGKYVYFYGSTDSTGIKGGTAATFPCFLNYSNINIQYDSDADGTPDVTITLDQYLGGDAGPPVIPGVGGACSGSSDNGNPFIGPANNLNVSRMCEGVVLMNTFLDSLTNVVDQLSGADFGELGGTQSLINGLKTNIVQAFPATADAVITQSQDVCESIYGGGTDPLEVYFAFFFESLFQ